jgi:hypothetical protein
MLTSPQRTKSRKHHRVQTGRFHRVPHSARWVDEDVEGVCPVGRSGDVNR